MKIVIPSLGKTDQTGEVMITRLMKQINSSKDVDAEIKVINEPDKQWNECIRDEVKDDQDVIIMDDDIIILEEDWFKKLTDSPFDVTGVKLMHASGIIQSYGGYIRGDGCGYNGFDGSMDIGLDEPMETPYVCFSTVYIKKKVLEKVPIMNPDFIEGSYFEDVDFCFRARQEGFSVGVIPIQFIHLESVTKNMDKTTQQKFTRNFEVFKGVNMDQFSEIKENFQSKVGGLSKWMKAH